MTEMIGTLDSQPSRGNDRNSETLDCFVPRNDKLYLVSTILLVAIPLSYYPLLLFFSDDELYVVDVG